MPKCKAVSPDSQVKLRQLANRRLKRICKLESQVREQKAEIAWLLTELRKRDGERQAVRAIYEDFSEEEIQRETRSVRDAWLLGKSA